MARTDSAAVKAILAGGRDYDTKKNPSLDPYIEWADAIIDDVVECASDDGITIDDARAKKLCGWLAAHAYKMSDQQFSSKSTGGASASFGGQTGKYLEATKYGQMALMLDPSGCLAIIIDQAQGNVPPTVGGGWLGTPRRQQTDYYGRGN